MALIGEINKVDKSGLSYIDYLQLLMIIQSDSKCLYHIMDLMQIHMQSKYQPKFEMSKCFSYVSFETDFVTRPLFTAIPWVMNPFQNGENYQFNIEGKASY